MPNLDWIHRLSARSALRAASLLPFAVRKVKKSKPIWKAWVVGVTPRESYVSFKRSPTKKQLREVLRHAVKAAFGENDLHLARFARRLSLRVGVSNSGTDIVIFYGPKQIFH